MMVGRAQLSARRGGDASFSTLMLGESFIGFYGDREAYEIISNGLLGLFMGDNSICDSMLCWRLKKF